MHDSFHGKGIVGGHLASFEDLAATTAELGFQLLEDASAANRLSAHSAPTRNHLDWRQLQRWNLDASQLSADAIVDFRELTAWEQYPGRIIAASGLIVIQPPMIVTLLVQTRRRRMPERLRAASQHEATFLVGKLLLAQEDERKRLARELHDDISQRLAASAINVGRLEGKMNRSQPARHELTGIREDIVALSEDVHRLSRQIHPSILVNLGLTEALRGECDRFAQREDIRIDFRAEPSSRALPNDVSLCLYRIAQGQGGGLPKAEWTLASVLKKGGYQTYFTGKWHLGESDYAQPNAHGYDEMKYCGLYHLNAYTYADPTWFPDMPADLRPMFQKVTTGSLSGKAGEKSTEDFKINGQYVDKKDDNVTLENVEYPNGVVGIPYFDGYVEKAAIEFLDRAAKDTSKPFFINVNFMKVHQPNLPAPEFKHKSLSKSKFADSIVELDTRTERIMDKLKETGLDKNTLVFYTTDNGAWQDVYPDAGYTPFRRTKGTVREGGNRVPAIAVWPGKIKPGRQ